MAQHTAIVQRTELRTPNASIQVQFLVVVQDEVADTYAKMRSYTNRSTVAKPPKYTETRTTYRGASPLSSSYALIVQQIEYVASNHMMWVQFLLRVQVFWGSQAVRHRAVNSIIEGSNPSPRASMQV